MSSTQLLTTTPVLPSSNIEKDVAWYTEKVGFETVHQDSMYAVIRRDKIYLHLQWHADTENDPLLGGSVVRILAKNITPLFEELVKSGCVSPNKMVRKTPWNTNEFGFYDLNKNAIFIAEMVKEK